MNRRIGYLSSLAAITLAAITLGAATPLAAADKEEALPRSLEKLAACKAIVDDAARLACYDRETGALVTAASEGEVKVVDKEDAKTIRRSLFGFQVPQIALFSSKNEKGEDTSIDEILNSKITAVTQLPRGNYRITITEGAIWETGEPSMRLLTPKVGQSIQLEKASLGAYWIRINGQPGVKGKRVG